jgi:dipeptidyl-peptidase-4
LTACQSIPKERKVKLSATYDLDTLYADQSIIGTTPIKPTWSADGNHLAFLWNDNGYTFRDVWSHSIESGVKQQLTQHADDFLTDRSITGGHSGISEVVWLDSVKSQIAYILDGKLYAKSASTEPQQLETDIHRIRSLAVSPNGQYLAFTADGSLRVRSVNITSTNGSKLLVDKGQPKAYIESFSWSQDSQKLVFQLTDNSPLPERDIYYYADADLQKYQVQRAFPGEETAQYFLGMVDIDGQNNQFFTRPNVEHYIWNYGLSADSQSLFINSSDLLVKEHSIYVFDVATGTREVFYREHDPIHLRPDWQVAWAPKDDGLIILTDKDGYLHLYHQQSADSEPQALTNGEWEIASFHIDQANAQVYFIANKSYLSERQIYRVSMAGGDVERISPTDPGSHQMTLSADKSHLASLFSSDAKPLELYLINLNNKESIQVTHSPRPEFHQHNWANISYIEFNSHLDDTKLVGRLSLPTNYNPNQLYPLIVGSVYSDSVQNQYGGRTSHPTWGLDQYLVAQGYIVFNVNVRGSWGQGRAHNQGLRYSYGGIDIEDLHSGVKHLVNEGFVDPNRVGIWGSSYGGLMTMMSLFKKPGVYAAGIAGAPATNVAHAYPGQMWVMGEPTGDDQPARYQQQSALYHTSGLADPLMIIHGTKDPVVLYADTIAVTEKLIAQQKMFELVSLPGTSHGWDNEGNDVRLFSFKKMVDFFDRHLK